MPRTFCKRLLPCAAHGSSRRRRSNRDAALALLLHPVGHGRAFMHFTDLVDHAGVKRMRSVSVVLPASMCAAMPMLRVRSSGYLRSGEFGFFVAGGFFESRGSHNLYQRKWAKGAVGLRHFMSVVAFLDRVALAGGGVFELLPSASSSWAHSCGDYRRRSRSSASRARPGARASLPSALDKWRHRPGAISPRDAGGRSPAPCLRLRGDQLRPTLREIYRSRYKRCARRAISCRASSRWK